jgi:hypothetical protein
MPKDVYWLWFMEKMLKARVFISTDISKVGFNSPQNQQKLNENKPFVESIPRSVKNFWE